MGCQTELRGWLPSGAPSTYCLTHQIYIDLVAEHDYKIQQASAGILVPDESKSTPEPDVPDSAKHPCGDTAVHDAHHWIEQTGPYDKEDNWCIGVPYMPTQPGDIVLDADKVAWVSLMEPNGPRFRVVFFYGGTPRHLATLNNRDMISVGPSMLRQPWTILIAKQVMDELDWTAPPEPPEPVKAPCPECQHSLNVHGFSGCVARSNADGMCTCRYQPPF